MQGRREKTRASLHVARPARRGPCRPRLALSPTSTGRERSLTISASISGQERHRTGGPGANRRHRNGGTTGDFSLSLSPAAAVSRSRLHREQCIRVPFSALFAVSSTRTTGSRSMTAREREGRKIKGRKGPARRRQRTLHLPAAVVFRRRHGSGLLFLRLYLKVHNQARATTPPNLRLQPQTYGSLPRRWPRGAARAQPARRGRPGAAPGSSATLMPQQLIAGEEPSSSSTTP